MANLNDLKWYFETKIEDLRKKPDSSNKIDDLEQRYANYGTKWSEFREIQRKRAENSVNEWEERKYRKMARFSHLYGAPKSYLDTEASVELDRAKIETVTVNAVRDYVNKQTKIDPNHAFRMHKRGSMDRLKDNTRKFNSHGVPDDDF